MVNKKPKPTNAGSEKPTNDVIAFMARLEHPRKAEIETLRSIILGADGRIRESIKWNAPSFAITEHFATVKLRPMETVQVVFHTGAKVKPTATAMEINDPAAAEMGGQGSLCGHIFRHTRHYFQTERIGCDCAAVD